MNLEKTVNNLIDKHKGDVHVIHINLANSETLDINQDFDSLYDQLDPKKVSQENRHQAILLKNTLQDEIKRFIPKLEQLEMILLLNSFNLKGRPIIDLFHKFENKARVMRTPEEFVNIIGGGFMALFYKVSSVCFVFFMSLHI